MATMEEDDGVIEDDQFHSGLDFPPVVQEAIEQVGKYYR